MLSPKDNRKASKLAGKLLLILLLISVGCSKPVTPTLSPTPTGLEKSTILFEERFKDYHDLLELPDHGELVTEQETLDKIRETLEHHFKQITLDKGPERPAWEDNILIELVWVGKVRLIDETPGFYVGGMASSTGAGLFSVELSFHSIEKIDGQLINSWHKGKAMITGTKYSKDGPWSFTFGSAKLVPVSEEVASSAAE